MSQPYSHVTHLELEHASKKYEPFRNVMAYWENCGEDDVKVPRQDGRMDPVLRLYHSCRLMLPVNKNVTEGQANGIASYSRESGVEAECPTRNCHDRRKCPSSSCASKSSRITLSFATATTESSLKYFLSSQDHTHLMQKYQNQRVFKQKMASATLSE